MRGESPVQDIEVKPATRSCRSRFWLWVTFASGVWLSACSQDGAPDRSVEVPGARSGPGAFGRPVGSQSPAPDAPPIRWMGLIGEYGPADDVWLILEDDFRLHLHPGEFSYPLEEESPDEFLGGASVSGAVGRLLLTRGYDGGWAGFTLR